MQWASLQEECSWLVCPFLECRYPHRGHFRATDPAPLSADLRGMHPPLDSTLLHRHQTSPPPPPAQEQRGL